MPPALKKDYCSKCGGKIEARPVAGRNREVCSVCDTIFYENPLPAAGALVLNEKRDVLLVRRLYQPNKGMWCLPIGFAEMGETIAEAALRELNEETGITGKIGRLIDADSWGSDFYGDLLVVTFEVDKVGGDEVAGDDADGVGYFPIGRLPPLAFPSNEKAIRICADLHRDEWAIQDSFLTLETGSGTKMLSDSLVGFLTDSSEYVARLWLADVRSSRTTIGYRRIDPEQLLRDGVEGLTLLGLWLTGQRDEERLRSFYRKLGELRKVEGVELHEVLSAIMLLKKQIWQYARSQGVWDNPVDTYRVMELQSRFAAYYDKAMYNAARGYAI
jgi:8-oxo-dGTP diphosphatase